MLKNSNKKKEFIDVFVSFMNNPHERLLDSKRLIDEGILTTNIIIIKSIDLEGVSFNSLYIPKRLENFVFENTVFSNLTYSGSLTFQNCVFGKEDEIIENQTTNNLCFKNFNLPMLYFFNCKLFNDVLSESNEIESLQFNSCDGKADLLFFKGNIKSVKIFSNKNSNKNLNKIVFNSTPSLESITIRDIKLESISFIGEPCKNIFIGDGEYENIFFTGSEAIGDFRIEKSNSNNSILKIGKLNLFGKQIKGDFQLNFIEVDELIFEELKSIDKSLSFRGVKVNKLFQFTASAIDKTYWNNVDFSTAELIFDYSFFKELKYANIQWGNNNFGITSSESGILRLKVLTEVFRQLKIIAGNNQNNFDKLKFQRLEYLNYWERVKQDKSETSTNRFLLRIDRIFSNFGQDYLRPLIWLLAVQFFLMILIWIREDCYHHFNASSYLAAFEKGLSQYASMIIPLFKTPEKWTGTSVTISIVIRLFNALMIYYFIRAVHKFGKPN